jgi:hypothetical protein
VWLRTFIQAYSVHLCVGTSPQDGNSGLVGQVVDSLVARRIQRLTRTHVTLPLADIAAQVGLPGADAAEYHVRR